MKIKSVDVTNTVYMGSHRVNIETDKGKFFVWLHPTTGVIEDGLIRRENDYPEGSPTRYSANAPNGMRFWRQVCEFLGDRNLVAEISFMHETETEIKRSEREAIERAKRMNSAAPAMYEILLLLIRKNDRFAFLEDDVLAAINNTIKFIG